MCRVRIDVGVARNVRAIEMGWAVEGRGGLKQPREEVSESPEPRTVALKFF